MGRKSRAYADAILRQALGNYNFNFRSIEKLVKNLFVWENLPDRIPSRFIENVLFNNGQAVFFKNPNTDCFIVSRVSSVKLNIYEEASCAIATTIKGNFPLKHGQFEMIYNNSIQTNSYSDVDYFATRLSKIDSAFDENIDQLKIPYIFTAPEGQVESVKALWRKKEEGCPFIIANAESFKNISYNLFDTHVVDRTGSLLSARNTVRNEYHNYFGIESAPSDKKERLLVSEVESNNNATSLYKMDMYNQRIEARDRINETFGTNIDVRINEVVAEQLETLSNNQNDDMIEGEENV